MTFYRWYRERQREKLDTPVLTMIEKQKAICTIEFVSRNLPARSRSSIEESIERLEKAGKIHSAGVGYVSSGMNDRLNVKDKRWGD